jgi:predicted esterase
MIDRRVSRRRFAAMAGGAFASFAFSDGCYARVASPVGGGRLSARPRKDVATASGDARRPLGLDASRDAILQLPSKAAAGPLPLLVIFHGAGGSGERMLQRVAPAADEAGVAVLAPDSRGGTWDAIRGDFAADVGFVDRALARVFETVSIDPDRIAAGGFSDGATYALSLGLVNGDLFRRVVAFSPGFIVGGTPQGKPRFFVTHGKADRILPIDQCSRVIVPQLQRRGYEVTFKEFDGGHQVPPDIALEALRWIGTR